MKNLFLLITFLILLSGCTTPTPPSTSTSPSSPSNCVNVQYNEDKVCLSDSRFEKLNIFSSSIVKGAWFDPGDDYMVIKLSSYKYYNYCGVSPIIWEAFQKASSFGSYYNQNIKEKYSCVKKIEEQEEGNKEEKVQNVNFEISILLNALPPSTETYVLNISIPREVYDKYKNNVLGHRFDFSKNPAEWATPDDPIIKSIAEELRDLEQKNKNFNFINNVFEIVRHIEYVSDYTKDDSGEYWNFPIETLVEGMGDCEDTSFLVAGLFGAIGWDVILTGLPGHMAIAIEMPDVVIKSLYDTDYIPFDYFSYSNKKYYYVETTNLNDFKLSEIPSKYKNVIPDFYSVINQNLVKENIIIPIAKTTQWKTFTSNEDNFKILFPSNPQIKTNYYRTVKYNTYEICVDYICYIASVMTGSESDNIFVPTLEQVSEIALMGQPNSTLLSINEASSNGYPAHDTIIKNSNNIYVKEKTIYTNSLLYTLRVSYTGNKCEENDCNQFFDSFKLIK